MLHNKPYNKTATDSLKSLFNRKLLTSNSAVYEEAMQLVREGANPNVRYNVMSKEGYFLLYQMVWSNADGRNDELIAELVKQHGANIGLKTVATDITVLQYLMNNGGSISAMMKLVRLGADPNQYSADGNTLLTLLTRRNSAKNDVFIQELIRQYDADIEKRDEFGRGLTALQWAISKDFQSKLAINLVHLGANPDTKVRDKTLLDYFKLEKIKVEHNKRNLPQPEDDTKLALYNEEIKKLDEKLKQLDEKIKELEQLRIKYFKELHHKSRNEFLNALILLASQTGLSKEPGYVFRTLPWDIIAHILSYMDFAAMGKTTAEGLELAHYVMFSKVSASSDTTVFSQCIKPLIKGSGGINVFQRDLPIDPNNNNMSVKTTQTTFTFFKSITTMDRDLTVRKQELKKQENSTSQSLSKKEFSAASQEVIDDFLEEAIPHGRTHLGLYKKQMNRNRLLGSIHNLDLLEKLAAPKI